MTDFGSVIFTRHYDTTPPHITIDRADPHVLVLDELLNEAAEHLGGVLRMECSPTPRLCNNGVGTCGYPSHPFCWTDWLMHIDTSEHHLVYRIGRYRPEQNVWEASWPD